MSSIVISFTIYLFAANIVAGTIYIFGSKKAGLLRIEYPFIYLPWIALMVIMPEFTKLPWLAESELSLKYFLFMLQGFSCGVIGGGILLPRLFIHSETTRDKLRVTLISALLFSGFYLFTRWLLLEAFKLLLL
ncbi:hypothetical protein ACFL4I_01315 [Pseudomonadota bacterium]